MKNAKSPRRIPILPKIRCISGKGVGIAKKGRRILKLKKRIEEIPNMEWSLSLCFARRGSNLDYGSPLATGTGSFSGSKLVAMISADSESDGIDTFGKTL